jgi:signal peptidase I
VLVALAESTYEGLRGLVRILAWAVFLAVVATAGFIAVGSATGKWRVTTLLTSSMSPDTGAGAAAVLVKTPAQDVRIGDVIAVKPKDEKIPYIHRVVNVWKNPDDDRQIVVVTRGDANGAIDDFSPLIISTPTVWEQKFAFPYIGRFFLKVEDTQTRYAIVGVLMLITIVSGLRAIWSGGHDEDLPVHGPFRSEAVQEALARV